MLVWGWALPGMQPPAPPRMFAADPCVRRNSAGSEPDGSRQRCLERNRATETPGGEPGRPTVVSLDAARHTMWRVMRAMGRAQSRKGGPSGAGQPGGRGSAGSRPLAPARGAGQQAAIRRRAIDSLTTWRSVRITAATDRYGARPGGRSRNGAEPTLSSFEWAAPRSRKRPRRIRIGLQERLCACPATAAPSGTTPVITASAARVQRDRRGSASGAVSRIATRAWAQPPRTDSAVSDSLPMTDR